jgi:putative phage-type endonuclease
VIQGSAEWHEWRLGGVGASEIATLMGEDDDNTPHGLWLVKTRRKKGWAGNWATDHGKETEAKARARYELLVLEDMEPAEGVHPVYSVCRASFDGVRSDKKLILEMKCPIGHETLTLAKAGKLPLKYMMQVQYQLAVSGADLCHFFVYHEKSGEHALVDVYPDLEMQGRLIAAALDFWTNFVVPDIPPPLTERDVKEIPDTDSEIAVLCNLLRDTKGLTKKEIDKIKAEAVRLAGHPKMRCMGVQISSVNRKGVFSYHKLTLKSLETA